LCNVAKFAALFIQVPSIFQPLCSSSFALAKEFVWRKSYGKTCWVTLAKRKRLSSAVISLIGIYAFKLEGNRKRGKNVTKRKEDNGNM
jgi:hypothetical protein